MFSSYFKYNISNQFWAALQVSYSVTWNQLSMYPTLPASYPQVLQTSQCGIPQQLISIHDSQPEVRQTLTKDRHIHSPFHSARSEFHTASQKSMDEGSKLPYKYTTVQLQFSHSVVSNSFAIPWTAACQATLSITNSQCLLKRMSIEPVMPPNLLILCCPLLLPPSILPSIRVFSNESVLHIKWPKDWRFNFSISCSNEYSGLISFRVDWLDLLAVQRTLKSLLQHHSLKISILRHFFLYSPTLTSIHDYWKNQSLEKMDLCWQSNVSAF